MTGDMTQTGLAGKAARLFVTGDTHGSHDVSKLNSREFSEGRGLSKDDFVLVAGDFGLPWSWPESGKDSYWLNWFEGKPWTTLFIDGNHENFDALGSFAVEEWHGGRVQRIRPSVIRLMRGELYDIAGMSVFTFGGATSIDRAYRTEGRSWWPQEMPSPEEMDHGRTTLDAHGWKVDVVVTHCAPSVFLHAINPTYGNDMLTEYLYEIERKLDYGHWYLGHYHVDQEIDWANASVLYDRVVEVGLRDQRES